MKSIFNKRKFSPLRPPRRFSPGKITIRRGFILKFSLWPRSQFHWTPNLKTSGPPLVSLGPSGIGGPYQWYEYWG